MNKDVPGRRPEGGPVDSCLRAAFNAMAARLPVLRTLCVHHEPINHGAVPNSEGTSNKPVHVLRRRGVKVSVFENRSGDTTFHKIAIQKIYRDDGGAWKTTSSYARDDIPIIKLLADRAWEWILDREAEPQND